MRTLGSVISKWLYNENDKCNDIRKNTAEKFANQQGVHAFIPESWKYFHEENHGQVLQKEEAQKRYEKLVADMQDKYHIDVANLLGYAHAISNIHAVLKVLYSIMPMDRDRFLEMTDLYRYTIYIEDEFDAHVVDEIVLPIHMLLADWKHMNDKPDGEGLEYLSFYNSAEMVCRNLGGMWNYSINVLDMAEAFIKEAGGIIGGSDENKSFCKIDNAKQLIHDMKLLAFTPYREKESVDIMKELGPIIGRHQIDGSTADDSPMNDNKANTFAGSVMLVIGLAILLAISFFFFPKLFIPIIVIVVALEVVVNVIPGKKE